MPACKAARTAGRDHIGRRYWRSCRKCPWYRAKRLKHWRIWQLVPTRRPTARGRAPRRRCCRSASKDAPCRAQIVSLLWVAHRRWRKPAFKDAPRFLNFPSADLHKRGSRAGVPVIRGARSAVCPPPRVGEPFHDPLTISLTMPPDVVGKKILRDLPRAATVLRSVPSLNRKVPMRYLNTLSRYQKLQHVNMTILFGYLF
jgi:hypothetical protein